MRSMEPVTRPGDAGALAEAIVRLAADPLLRTRLGVAARELSRAFGWDAIAAQTVEVYRAVTR